MANICVWSFEWVLIFLLKSSLGLSTNRSDLKDNSLKISSVSTVLFLFIFAIYREHLDGCRPRQDDWRSLNFLPVVEARHFVLQNRLLSMKYLTRSHVFPPSYTFVLELRWPVDVDLEMATSILRYHHEVRVVALYEIDEVLLLLVWYDDLLPLLFLQPQTCQGVFLEELHPCSFQ